MGADIPEVIRHFGDKIHFVHFRDVAGEVSNFRETFHDNGKTDMHGAGDEGDPTGYTMLGKIFAVGYMRGLIESVMKEE